MTNEKIVLYIMLAIGAVAIIYFLRKVSPMISISGNRIAIRKYLFPTYINFNQIREIQMIAFPDSEDGEGITPVIKITFKFTLLTGEVLIINIANKFREGGLFSRGDNDVFLKAETIKEIYKENPSVKLDTYTKDYMETGTAEKFIKSFRG